MANPNMVKGGPSLNPSGLSSEERAARDALRLWLATDMLQAGKEAYRRCLEADNPAIVKDFMDRIAGKVKEHVSMTDGEGNPIAALNGATLAQLLELLSAAREAKK